jgi:amino acid efflux transporter
VVCYLGAGYLAELLGAGRGLTALAAAALLLTVLAVSLRGIRTSAAVQLQLVGVLVLVIAVAVVGALPGAERRNWTPFAPYGWSAVGSAATVLMLSFVGWEAIAPLTDRFADPREQLPRVIGAAFAATTLIYLALAAATVAVLGTGAGTAVPVADLLTRGIGRGGDAVAAGAAVLLTVGAANAYLAGGATLARTLTTRRGPDFPRWFLVVLVVSGLTGLGLIGTGTVSVATAVSVPSAFFFVVYLACMASAVRVLAGPFRVAAVVASGAILVVLAYARYAVIPVAAVVAVSVLLSRRRLAGIDRTPAISGPRCRTAAASGRGA